MRQTLPENLTDEELARYFEEHKGDVSLWEKKPLKIRVRRGGPSTVFSVRFAPEELERLQRAADIRGITVSDFIRSVALSAESLKVQGDAPRAAGSLDNYVDLVEAARILEIHPQTLRRLIKQRKVSAVIVAGKYLIERHQLEMLASNYRPRFTEKPSLAPVKHP
jgi:hypothetical protein